MQFPRWVQQNRSFFYQLFSTKNFCYYDNNCYTQHGFQLTDGKAKNYSLSQSFNH
jgi:hypothetical protein